MHEARTPAGVHACAPAAHMDTRAHHHMITRVYKPHVKVTQIRTHSTIVEQSISQKHAFSPPPAPQKNEKRKWLNEM